MYSFFPMHTIIVAVDNDGTALTKKLEKKARLQVWANCGQMNFMAMGYSWLFLLVTLKQSLQHDISCPVRRVSYTLSQKCLFIKDN